MMQLALITGGAVRIGRAIALRMAKSGFLVAGHYNRAQPEAEGVGAAILEMGGTAACFQAEIGDHTQVEALIPAVNRAMGLLTCLVNNAAHFVDDRLPDLTSGSLEAHLAVNLKAPLFLS